MRERAHFAAAIRTKMVREIADVPGPGLIQPAQAEARANCNIGEWLRRLRPWN